ncbi:MULTISPECIES: septum site-determining protein MinC [Halomonadaceae]|uniref:Probable septum site-determining protein MinC n=1 Tax=Vreelandella janggokensis TaxID=370767 RepID=A0ABT4IY82_9GAMM|nr:MULTISPECIES: septum site-determining protein MinC [Halomonas]MCW4150221.1 septum site-determining protein MinC [Halomonas sp. 18H]MCZ0928637.1 septum site-determining protein MinC [Halomonas janggokensis]MCZ0931372.1 septum site-determining protein MinC [Halomonas janggokensis]MDR5887597.1 septum site-determining protein MinC [Halomonas janggokensis]QPL46653.1 septum site-determining protein MinC [Halomonas sp. A40-4]
MSLNVDSADVAFTFKGGMLPMTVMELSSADPEHIRRQLAGKLSQSPAFFQHTPVVLSVEKLDEPHLSLERICAVCRDHKLLPVAVRGGTEPVRQSAWALGLGWFAPVDESRAQMLKSVGSDSESAAPVAVADANTEKEAADAQESNGTETTRLYRGTVRSGQQVSASGGDLVVIGAVNAGAEVLAAGSIHVYGALRGRALAGIHGNTQAGIYCRELAAELLSVAGNYKRLEDIDSQLLGAPAEVHFTQQQLEIKPLN